MEAGKLGAVRNEALKKKDEVFRVKDEALRVEDATIRAQQGDIQLSRDQPAVTPKVS